MQIPAAICIAGKERAVPTVEDGGKTWIPAIPSTASAVDVVCGIFCVRPATFVHAPARKGAERRGTARCVRLYALGARVAALLGGCGPTPLGLLAGCVRLRAGGLTPACRRSAETGPLHLA
eukprot:350065-Chlamydomonas_euryale.AAC.8